MYSDPRGELVFNKNWFIFAKKLYPTHNGKPDLNLKKGDVISLEMCEFDFIKKDLGYFDIIEIKKSEVIIPDGFDGMSWGYENRRDGDGPYAIAIPTIYLTCTDPDLVSCDGLVISASAYIRYETLKIKKKCKNEENLEFFEGEWDLKIFPETQTKFVMEDKIPGLWRFNYDELHKCIFTSDLSKLINQFGIFDWSIEIDPKTVPDGIKIAHTRDMDAMLPEAYCLKDHEFYVWHDGPERMKYISPFCISAKLKYKASLEIRDVVMKKEPKKKDGFLKKLIELWR